MKSKVQSLHLQLKQQMHAEIGLILSDAGVFKKPVAKKIYRVITSYLNWIEREGGFTQMEKKWCENPDYITIKEQNRIHEEGGISDGNAKTY